VSIAKILVPICGAPRDEIAMTAAVRAARPFNSHIQVFSAYPDPALAIPLVGAPMTQEVIRAIVDGQVNQAKTVAAQTRAMMAAVCHREGAQVVEKAARGDVVTCSFRQVCCEVERAICDAASLSDLVVFGPVRWRENSEFNEAFLNVLRTVRRPVLISNAHSNDRFRKIAIGWDGSTAAAHAISCAIPFLRSAERVDIITLHQPGEAEAPTPDLNDYLVRNDVNFVHRACDIERNNSVEVLLAEAGAADADMLIAGGYGHDHLREALFGGVTQSLLAKADIPILFAH
jgi:hypothetical protein